MKVLNYSVQQSSTHKLEMSKEASEQMNFWTGAEQSVDNDPSYILDIDHDTYQSAATKTSRTSTDDSENIQDQQTETKLRLIEALVYQMTGKRVKLQAPQMRQSSSDHQTEWPDAKISTVQERDSWGLIYEYQETMAENESIRFNSGGTVITSEGKTIMFSMEFSMSRSYYQQNRVNIRMGNAVMVDPLMMVIKGGAPTLSRERAAFDLDSDGNEEQVAFATGNSAFLALDRNGDGEINDGSELFGPQSGNGFMELRAFDLDRNGWIDESDDVFSQLSLLSLADGEKTLVHLADVGVGAIYLQEVSTPFEMKDTEDEYGEISSSSVFLREDGSIGTVHHIDLQL